VSFTECHDIFLIVPKKSLILKIFSDMQVVTCRINAFQTVVNAKIHGPRGKGQLGVRELQFKRVATNSLPKRVARGFFYFCHA
jgi:hypothetical protein